MNSSGNSLWIPKANSELIFIYDPPDRSLELPLHDKNGLVMF